MSMKKASLSVLPLILFALQACAPIASPQPSAPPVAPSSEYTLNEISLYENDLLALQEDEYILIEDVLEGRLLLNIYKNYKQEDPNFRETGYNSATRQLIVYDLKQDSIAFSFDVSSAGFCTSAIFLTDDAVVCTILIPQEGSNSECKIVKIKNGQSEELISGDCIPSGFDDPKLIALSNTMFAYSYFNPHSKEFGVNAVTEHGEIIPHIALTDDGSTEFLRTDLCGNGTQYLYYTAVEGTATMFVADKDGILSQFSLSKEERVFDYCFLDNAILFTMQIVHDSTTTEKIIVKDFSGATLLEVDSQPYFRLKSDFNSIVLGIDGKYQIYSITVSDDEVVTQKIQAPVAPALFYPIGIRGFLLHYNGDWVEKDRLLYALSF